MPVVKDKQMLYCLLWSDTFCDWEIQRYFVLPGEVRRSICLYSVYTERIFRDIEKICISCKQTSCIETREKLEKLIFPKNSKSSNFSQLKFEKIVWKRGFFKFSMVSMHHLI